MTLLNLPSDILILVLQNLLAPELGVLCRTCRSFNVLVNTYGWPQYIRFNPRPSYSLSKARMAWPSKVRVQYDVLSDQSWARSRFVARPLSRPWAKKQQPVLAISKTRLVVAAGNTIYSYKFGSYNAGLSNSPVIHYEGSYSLAEQRDSSRDITAMTFVDGGQEERTLMCGFRNGEIFRVRLSANLSSHTLLANIDRLNDHHLYAKDIIENLSAEDSLLLSLSSNGRVALANVQSVHPSSSPCLELGARSWTAYLNLKGTLPYAAFGVSSPTSPLSIYSICTDGLSANPIALLGGRRNETLSSPAVYGICCAPISSPWGSSPQIIVSGWYDGRVRCYDLRSAVRESSTDSNSDLPTRLTPVMTLSDPWSFDPIYSVSSGGGAASHIAAGSARHGVVSFWDIRSPKAGWSVYAPGNDRSPVYSVLLESSRVFGATDSRPFVYDFGPGVTQDTYPYLFPTEGLKQRKSNPASFYVTRYSHGHGSTINDH